MIILTGRTIHSKTKAPIKLDKHSKCNFKPNSATAELIQRASFMVFDEFTIGHKGSITNHVNSDRGSGLLKICIHY